MHTAASATNEISGKATHPMPPLRQIGFPVFFNQPIDVPFADTQHCGNLLAIAAMFGHDLMQIFAFNLFQGGFLTEAQYSFSHLAARYEG